MKRSIKKIAVLGSGVMGSRIGCHFANIGVEVILLDIVPKNAANDKKSRNKIVDDALAFTLKANPSPIYKKAFAKRITTGNFEDNMDEIATCDWIIEVVVECLDIKKQVFKKVELYRKPGTLITSNTSGIPIHLMNEGRSDDFKKHFCGTHFFNPPRYLRLLEIIPTPNTSSEVIDFLMHYGELYLGKTTVLCKDTPAFIGNRIGVYGIMSLFHLVEKMDNNALVSEPLEPITWWIENTTPKEYRQTILDAGNRWNEAFETAGFKNAVVMKVQPDNAEWEAGDIRYNVLRWTSSSKPYFGGYGPSFVNPRTGEIMGADIMLEYIFVTNKLKLERTLVTSATEVEDVENDINHFCTLGDHLHLSNMFGVYALSTNDASPEMKDEFLKQSLYYLVLHEMGHTIGLTHNMKATQLYSPTDIHNKTLTEKTGIQSSVMDYPSANISSDKNKQGYFFTQRPGPYDKWVIEYAYSQALSDSTAEENRLKSILSRSTEPPLMYGNDADDMRSPGSVAMDPRVMIDDLSNDAISYSIGRIKLAQEVGMKLKDKYNSPDKSYQELQNQFFVTNSQIYLSAGIISRYIGGIYVDRGFVGQKGASQPYTPVSYKDQKRAMEALSKYIFSAQAMQYPKELYGYLQNQRRGFSTGEDPRIHEKVLNIQKSIFDHLLSVQVLLRITDSEIYGNEYVLNEMISDITNAVFKEDIINKVSSFRENLQLEYVSRLCAIINSTMPTKYDHRTQSHVLAQLKNIQKMVTTNPGLDTETKIHRQHILFKIDSAFKQNK